MAEADICPFSKSIATQWAQCPHARLIDHRSGKMQCTFTDIYFEECQRLLKILKEKSRFVLGAGKQEQEITHADMMKVQCGGIQGMQRILEWDDSTPPVIIYIIAAATLRYGDVNAFPYSEIVKDIQSFSLRGK